MISKSFIDKHVHNKNNYDDFPLSIKQIDNNFFLIWFVISTWFQHEIPERYQGKV